MTLTGRAAEQHPDVDILAPVVIEVAMYAAEAGGRHSTGAERADVLGIVDPETGTYRSVSNAVTEKDRRTLGLRRNSRPRRQQASRNST